jgi:Na+-translocating ferredoxin:NAD+ oxidoreductase subunit B
MLSALFAACVIAAVFVTALRRLAPTQDIAPPTPLVERIDALLPQTQCGQCNFAGCRPYAEAIADGSADINRCPPGGDAGITALANLLGIAPKPLDPAHGRHAPRTVALIDEAVCIGCTKCIQVCPVDAILGAPQVMHSILSDECTGCGLCLVPCPVDCITLLPAQSPIAGWRPERSSGDYAAPVVRSA